jgi:hypothetical protein
VKCRELAMSFEKRFLNDVGRVDLSLQSPANFHPRQKSKITLIRGKQPTQHRCVTRLRFVDQLFDFGSHLLIRLTGSPASHDGFRIGKLVAR